MAKITIHYDAASRHVTVDYSALENKVRRGSALGRVATWIAPLALAFGFGNAACDGSTGDDADVPTDSDGTDSTNLPPNPIDGTHVLPSDGRVYNVGDLIPVVLTVPSDPEGDSLTGTVDIYGDTDGTPGESAGDARGTVDLGTLVAGETASGEIDTSTAGAGGTALPGTPEGQAYTLTINVNDGQGGKSSLTRNISLRGGNRVKYCETLATHAGANFHGFCHSADDAGDYGDGDWEIDCDLAGGCVAASGEIAATGQDVGIYTVRVRSRRSASDSWSPWYSFKTSIGEVETKIGVSTSAGNVDVYGPIETIAQILENCVFPGFNRGSIPPAGSDPYAGEMNTGSSSPEETRSMLDCITEESYVAPGSDEASDLANRHYAQGQLPQERLSRLRSAAVNAIQYMFSINPE